MSSSAEPPHDAPAGSARHQTPFVPPPYPYDRLDALKSLATADLIDLTIGTPVDSPSPAVIAALASSGAERGYPSSVGNAEFREAAAHWLDRRLGVNVDPATQLAAAVGTKEFVTGVPHWLRLRTPERDTVLYPAVSYPSYAMGATLAGCRAVPVPCDEQWRLEVRAIDPDDAARALLLWVNTPGNPAGGLDDLAAVAAWGRAHDVPVFSDECYVEFTWDGPPRTVLDRPDQRTTTEHTAPDHAGLVALHSLSKRSNLAGARVGFYAGDAELVDYLSEVRKHVGLMVPGPVQAAAVVALGDQQHVDDQRTRYHHRLTQLARVLETFDVAASLPQGGFYLWVRAPDDDAWAFTRRLAAEAGLLVSPGEFYGEAGAAHVRIAAVCTDVQLEALRSRRGLI